MGTSRHLLCLGALLACIGGPGAVKPASASQIGSGLCDPPSESASSQSASNARLRIDRYTAIQTLKHVQRACQLLQEFEATDSVKDKPALVSKLKEITDRLGRGILAPIVSRYPDLRGRDFTSISMAAVEHCLPLSGSKPASGLKQCKPHMGLATASYIRKVINDAQQTLIVAIGAQVCKEPEPKACIDMVTNLIAEIGFANTNIYADYPQLWLLETRESLKRYLAQGVRTPASDASFRKGAPPKGSVKLSPAALSKLQEFSTIHAGAGPECEVVALMWVKESAWKRPDDAEWTKKGPGLAIGSYACSQVPPDIIETQRGIKVLFNADDPGRFAVEMVDFESGKWVLKPYSSAADPSSTHAE